MKNLVVLVCLLFFASPALAQWSASYQTGVMGTSGLTLKSKTRTGNFAIVPGNTCETEMVQGLAVEYRYKRIGVAADFTYNGFHSGHQPFTLISNDPAWGTLAASPLSGNVFAIALLVKYYHPITEKVSLFVGAGPGLIYSVIEGSDLQLGHAVSVSPMLVAEAGARLFILTNFSADLFARYRYSSPSYEFNIGVAGPPLYMQFGYNNFMGGLRLTYHF